MIDHQAAAEAAAAMHAAAELRAARAAACSSSGSEQGSEHGRGLDAYHQAAPRRQAPDDRLAGSRAVRAHLPAAAAARLLDDLAALVARQEAATARLEAVAELAERVDPGRLPGPLRRLLGLDGHGG